MGEIENVQTHAQKIVPTWSSHGIQVNRFHFRFHACVICPLCPGVPDEEHEHACEDPVTQGGDVTLGKPPKAWEWPGISKKAGRLASKPVTEKWWKEGPVTRHKTHKADLFGASQIPVVGWIFDQKGEMGHGNDLCSQAAWCSFPFMFVLRCFDNLPSHSQIWQWKAHQACPFIEDLPIKPWFFPTARIDCKTITINPRLRNPFGILSTCWRGLSRIALAIPTKVSGCLFSMDLWLCTCLC